MDAFSIRDKSTRLDIIMRALLQRVTNGRVTIEGRVKGEIGNGLVILLGVGAGDTEAEIEPLANKIANLRIFSDSEGKFNLSAMDVKAEMLVVSQFTLYADCRKGRRPSFTDAARPEIASPLCDSFVEKLRALGFKVETGEFQADMLVEIHNAGPVTIWLDTDDLSPSK
jgi:D-tyrosyl-tRNA(Tyr) deacylase